MGALIIGVVAGVVCVWGVNGLKRLLRADDALDVFGVHGVGGIVGALLTGVFNAQVSVACRRPGADRPPIVGPAGRRAADHRLVRRIGGIIKIANALCGLRVPEDQEREKAWT